MRAGKLRHRVIVQRRVEATDPQGGIEESWTTLAYRWASVEPLRGTELFTAQQIEPKTTHRVRLRWDSEPLLSTKDRLEFRGRVLNIGSMLNVDERRREFELMCEEVT